MIQYDVQFETVLHPIEERKLVQLFNYCTYFAQVQL